MLLQYLYKDIQFFIINAPHEFSLYFYSKLLGKNSQM